MRAAAPAMRRAFTVWFRDLRRRSVGSFSETGVALVRGNDSSPFSSAFAGDG